MKIDAKGERLKLVPQWVKFSYGLPGEICITDCKFTIVKLNVSTG